MYNALRISLTMRNFPIFKTKIKFLACIFLLLYCTRQAFTELTPQNQQIVSDNWKQYIESLSAVVVNDKPMIELLGDALKHNFSLSHNQLRKGVVYTGAGYRLRKVVSRLMQGGGQVKLGVVGGSITFINTMDIEARSWWTKLSRYVKSAFPQTQVLSKNGAIPGTPSSYAVMCLELMLEEDVDIVFVEYIVNDGFTDSILKNRQFEIYELLLRRILNKSHKPAVVLMQVPSHGMGHRADSNELREFHYTPEDLYGSLAQYYDIGWLSMRDVYWRLGRLHKDGYREQDFFYDDFLHPGGPLGQRLMADLAVLLLQDTAINLILHPWNSRDEAFWGEALPPPMHKGNYEPTSNLCIHNEDLKSVVISAEGFHFVNEGTTEKKKLGYVSTAVGSRLVLRVNTKQPKVKTDNTENVLIAYLRSYEHMGTARVECIAGCTCEARELQAYSTEHNSQIHLLKLFPTAAEDCTISITVQEKTLSGEHKIKITGVMVDSYSSYHEGEWGTSLWHELSDKNKQALTKAGLLLRA